MGYFVKRFGVSRRGIAAKKEGKIRIYTYSDGEHVFIDGIRTPAQRINGIYNINGKQYVDNGEWHHGKNGTRVRYIEPINNN